MITTTTTEVQGTRTVEQHRERGLETHLKSLVCFFYYIFSCCFTILKVFTITHHPSPLNLMGPLTLNVVTTNTNSHGYPHNACTNPDHDASMNGSRDQAGEGNDRVSLEPKFFSPFLSMLHFHFTNNFFRQHSVVYNMSPHPLSFASARWGGFLCLFFAQIDCHVANLEKGPRSICKFFYLFLFVF